MSTTTWGYLVISVSVLNWPAASAQVLIPNRAHSVGQRPHHVLDRGPGGAGVDHAGHPVVRGEGDAQDLAAALRDEGLGRRRVGHQPGALDVQVDHGPEPFRGDRLGRAEELAAGVVDEHVEALVALEHAVEEGPDGLLLADVELLVLEGAGQAGGELGGLGERLRAPAAADHDGAEAHQLERRLAAEAAARAGDDADLAVEQAGPEDPRLRRRLSAPSAGSLYMRLRPGNLGRG